MNMLPKEISILDKSDFEIQMPDETTRPLGHSKRPHGPPFEINDKPPLNGRRPKKFSGGPL